MNPTQDKGAWSVFKRGARYVYQRYLIEAMGAMAKGLFASLIVGLIISQFAKIPGLGFLDAIAQIIGAKSAVVGAAIGVAIAWGLKEAPLVIFASAATGALGYDLGGPVGAYLAALVGAEIGRLVSGKTPLDIVVTPIVTIVAGGLVARFAGAATVGCGAQMVGFAVASFRENGWGGLLSQGLGTSMLQVPNILKRPAIWIAPTLAGAILGPISTCWLQMTNTAAGAGMGTSGLVGQFGTWAAMAGTLPSWLLLVEILVMHFLAPALLTLGIDYVLRRIRWVKEGDMKLAA